MSEVDKLERAIRRNIVLHERFCELIEKEKNLFGYDEIDGISAQRKLKDEIEREIKKSDVAISEMFKHIEDDKIKLNETQKKKVSVLTDNYRIRIDSTIQLIEQTGKVLQNYKDDTMKELKMVDKKKKALNIYKGNK
ncbi:MAG: hypothetical protein JXB48_00630 [Candidatus Latescibacteria bacterium]|nr:hypothetical protein [Candidatus Latescibacterota bacterium]